MVVGEREEAGRQGVRAARAILVSEHDQKAESVAALAENAMDAYLSRRFGEATRIFEAILGILPADVATLTLRDRARHYEGEPPPEDWSGAYVMTEK